jgi:hypothetical protein
MDQLEFNYNGCDYHSKSYYCQPKKFSVKPKTGSPDSCSCEKVELSGKYSAGILLKCTECLEVKMATEKNSCPEGMKIFAPASKEDWQTFLASAQPLRAPNFIVDITRKEDGCGGCAEHPMMSTEPHQATWRTSDGAPWWLRELSSEEPSADYEANCYMDITNDPQNENDIQFDADGCKYSSRSYYCQPAIEPMKEAQV